MASVNITLLGGFAVTVDGSDLPPARWTRRHAAALVKVLALAPGRRLHRERVLDLLWPDEPVTEALPKLHKAAHFARRALDVPNAVVLRGENVLLLPEADVGVDVDRFERLARQALDDTGLARDALAAYPGELLPHDRYEQWARERRDQLRLRQLELLRLDGRWEELLDLDPTDEPAHLALMRRHRADGDHLAALRQYERLARALHRELGLTPGPEAIRLRERILAERDARPPAMPLLGRDREICLADELLRATHGRTLIITGAAGMGKSALVAAIAARAAERGLRVGTGTSAAVEGSWPYAPVLEALAQTCHRDPALLADLPDVYRGELERAIGAVDTRWNGEGSHQRLFAAAAELVGLASASTGLLLVIEDVQDADDASLRLLHHMARIAHGQRVWIVVSHRPDPMTDTLVHWRRSLLDRYGALEIALGPLDTSDVERLVHQHVREPDAELLARIDALGRGIPFAVHELARRAAAGSPLDSGLFGIPGKTREVLARVAVAGSFFDTDEFVALSGLPEHEAFDHLDAALTALVVEPASAGYRFRHALLRQALLADLREHQRRHIHREAATRLVGLDAAPSRIGHHLLSAGAGRQAVPYLRRAAHGQAAVGAYREALALLDALWPHATAAERAEGLALRGDLLNAVGDPSAVSAYRQALAASVEPRAARRLRIRLGHAAMLSGDLRTASAALDGLAPDGGADDADLLLVRGKLAYFTGDYPSAHATAEQAQRLVLAREPDWKVLDLVTLQAMLAHRSGGWFDRMRAELERTRDSPRLAHTVFDGSLCSAEYLLYGPTPYPEVIALARDLEATARRSGAARAAAFAAALLGEAALLSGDLELAARSLTRARRLHHEVGSAGGQAHAGQRLAEVRLAQGDRDQANRLLREALPLAHRSTLARHLLYRVYGTMIAAAADPDQARVLVDRGEACLGWDDRCSFCSVMFFVPATIACARVNDLPDAQRMLDRATDAAQLWDGTSWWAAIAEARAAVALARGDLTAAHHAHVAAAEGFGETGQPLDARRCRAAARQVAAQLASATHAGGANSSS